MHTGTTCTRRNKLYEKEKGRERVEEMGEEEWMYGQRKKSIEILCYYKSWTDLAPMLPHAIFGPS